MLGWTWIGKTCKLVKSIYIYTKERLKIGKYFYSQDFADIIKRYTNVSLDKDWLGRLYGVINPSIDINGNINLNNTIIEIDGENTNNDEYLKNWMYKQLNLIASVFSMRNLYTYIDMTIEHVGPLEADNYLVIFDMVSRKALAESFKKWIVHTSIYAIIAILGYIVFMIYYK